MSLSACLALLSTLEFHDALQPPKHSSNLKHDNSNENWPLPVLKPMQHSFFSTNASASASFITRYFKGTKLLPSSESDGRKSSIVEYCPRPEAECITMKFFEVDDSTHLQKDFVKASDDEWSRVASAAMGLTRDPHTMEYTHSSNYSTWIDFHDGLSGDAFDVDLAIKEGVKLQKYSFGPLRVPLPSTLYTIELIEGFTKEDEQRLIEYAGVAGPDKCRDREAGFEANLQGVGYWWKSTYATTDPEAAANFAVHALGAQRIQSPFVERAPYCPVVRWVMLPNGDLNRTEEEADTEMSLTRWDDDAEIKEPLLTSGIMLHFIKNPSWPQGNMTPGEMVEDIDKHRHMTWDHFDEYMYNHVGFQTASLDPFIERFQKMDLPFIVRRSRDDFAVYVNVPQNNIVFKVTSPKAPTLVNANTVDEAP